MLTGSRDKSNKGIIDLYMYKYDMKTYLLGPLSEMHAFQSEAKDTLRAIFKDHHTYRQKMRPIGCEHEPDLSFMSAWRKSTEKLAYLIEALVFDSRDDGLLKVAMKSRKTPASISRLTSPRESSWLRCWARSARRPRSTASNRVQRH